MAAKDEQEMQRIETQIRAARARIDADVRRVQAFIEAWSDFIGMFTVANAREKAGSFLGSAMGDAGSRAEAMFEKVVGRFSRR